MHLPQHEQKMLNDIFARAVKKHTAGLTTFTDLITVPDPMTDVQAAEAARLELEHANGIRRDQINQDHEARYERLRNRLAKLEQRFNDKVTAVTTQAGRRGVQNSTIVLDQIHRLTATLSQDRNILHAEMEHIHRQQTLALNKLEANFETRIGALAKRLQTDSVRQNIAAVREKSLQAYRSGRALALSGGIQSAQDEVAAQRRVDEEVYAHYLRFLLSKPPIQARQHIEHDMTFYFNLSQTYFTRLRNEIRRRAPQVTCMAGNDVCRCGFAPGAEPTPPPF